MSEPWAVLDVKPGRYFVGVWFVSGGERQMDWMATLFRDPGETRWTMRSRFRYYAPASKDPNDGKDERSNHEGAIEGSEKEVMAKIDYVANALVTASGMQLDYVPMMTDDAEAIIERLRSKPWCHVKLRERA